MKKIILCLFLFSTLGLTDVQAQNNKTTTTQTKPQRPKRAPGTEGPDVHAEAKLNSPLPDFTLTNLLQKSVTKKDIPEGNSVIFAMFNPGCGHCVDLGKMIANLKDSLKTTTVVLMTFQENFKELTTYVQTTGLEKMAQVHVGIANNQFILNHFMPSYTIPQIMFYNKQKKLKKIVYEKIESKEILQYITL